MRKDFKIICVIHSALSPKFKCVAPWNEDRVVWSKLCESLLAPRVTAGGDEGRGPGRTRLEQTSFKLCWSKERDKWDWTDQARASDHTYLACVNHPQRSLQSFFGSPNISRAINTVTDCLEMSKFQASFWNVRFISGNLSFKWRIIPCIFPPISRARGGPGRIFSQGEYVVQFRQINWQTTSER